MGGDAKPHGSVHRRRPPAGPGTVPDRTGGDTGVRAVRV